MSKHLPPPKSKHLKKNSTAKRRGHKRREEFKRANIYFVILAAALFGAMYFVPLEGRMLQAAYSIPFLAAGWKIIIEALEELLDGRAFSGQLLLSVAGITALAVGYCEAAVIIMLCASLCAIIRGYADIRKRRVLGGIVAMCPKEAVLEYEGGAQSVSLDKVCVGDIIRVGKGERIPLDGVVIEGQSELDCFAITANSKHIEVTEGSGVVSGCMNTGEPLRIRVVRDSNDSTVYRMVSYIERYEEFEPRLYRVLGKFCDVFTPVAAVAALLIAILPPILNSDFSQWTQWIGRGVALMAAAAPCTLLASASLAYFGGIGGAVYGGALIKDSNRLEALASTVTMAFGRTGVVSDGEYKIIEVVPNNMSEEALLEIAATAEEKSSHPIAAVIREAAQGIEPEEGEVREFIDIPGKGVSAFFAGMHVYVGNAKLMDEHDILWVPHRRPGIAVHVAIDNRYAGYIIVADDIKDGAFDAMEDLRVQGVKQPVLLTGGVRSASKKLASALNFEMVKAELGPEDMYAALEYLKANKIFGTALAFVGKGDDDKAFMELADLGIALGAYGNYEALENCGVVIMDNDIRVLPKIRKIAQTAVNIVKLNFYVCMGSKALLAIFALCGILGPTPIVLLDCAVSIALVVNSFRTLNSI